jgi:hypothetical protein
VSQGSTATAILSRNLPDDNNVKHGFADQGLKQAWIEVAKLGGYPYGNDTEMKTRALFHVLGLFWAIIL